MTKETCNSSRVVLISEKGDSPPQAYVEMLLTPRITTATDTLARQLHQRSTPPTGWTNTCQTLATVETYMKRTWPRCAARVLWANTLRRLWDLTATRTPLLDRQTAILVHLPGPQDRDRIPRRLWVDRQRFLSIPTPMPARRLHQTRTHTRTLVYMMSAENRPRTILLRAIPLLRRLITHMAEMVTHTRTAEMPMPTQ